MRAEFTACVRFHLGRIEAAETTTSTALHHDCYREARARFRLPASTTQQARDQAIHARKSYVGSALRTIRGPGPQSGPSENHFCDPYHIRIMTYNPFQRRVPATR
jgi:hypothetical protein